MMDAATPRPDLDTMRRELEEARHAMRAAIEARDVPEIECVFLRAHQILTDAQVLELRYKREKNIESQRRYWEIALGVERLRGQWLTDTEKKGLRYIRPKNTKFGAPTGLIRLDAAGQPPRIGIERKKSQDLQAFARLTEQQFQAVLADKTKMLTVAGILRLYAPKSTGDGANPGGGEKRTVSLDVIRADERAQPRAALDEDQVSEYVEAMMPDADAEDESLLHSLDTPDPDSLPRVSVEALQEKRKLVIEGMKADRACLAARPAPKPVEPAADLNQPAVHNDVDAPTTSQNLSAALKHAGAGFAVFLCDQHKKPRGKWRDISTTDPETIRLWFQTWPDSIVGIDLAKSGLIVVDADRHDPEHDGVDALGRLESENEPFENHPIIWTPRNGFHHVFRQPPGIPLGNTTGALPKGIDIRGAGGFVIACGSISTVFGEWVAADGSLIEAFRAGTIPTLPDWLAAIIQTRPTKVQPSDNVVPFKPRDPKEKVPNEPGAAPRPASSPTSRQKKRAAVALQGNAAELATTQPGNRNNRLNVLSYRMGRFVALGSITRQQVIEAFTAACEANGLILDDRIDSVMRTIKSGLAAGMKKPLEDIAARSSDKRQGRNPYEREVQRSEVMALFRLRFGPHASYEAVDDVLAKIDSDDKEVIGRELGFTFEQYKRMGVEPLGRRRAKHPSTIKPFNATDDEIQAHLKECEKSRNSAAHRKRRAKLAEARKAVEDLDDRSSAVLTFLQHSAGPQSIAQIAAGIRKSRAFADLTDNALRRTILRLVKPPSKLAERVVLIEGKNKNGKKTFLMELRK